MEEWDEVHGPRLEQLMRDAVRPTASAAERAAAWAQACRLAEARRRWRQAREQGMPAADAGTGPGTTERSPAFQPQDPPRPSAERQRLRRVPG